MLISRFRAHRSLVLPLGVAGLVLVLFVPLPPGAVDILLTMNIALSALVLLTTLYVSSPLEFSVFPSLLLGTTLYRLVLNVATTRLILTSGAYGRPLEQAQLAAGKVIWAFGSFVAGGSLTVGVILFLILVVIQFVVITRGAARIAEVAARFVLDAMPGKQATIEAELSAGLIDEHQARQRRNQVAGEADFYGAMDGATKFLRGDAVAAAIITLVNILGGLYIGLVQYGLPWSAAVDLFTRLTIGDGLVTQVPAFLISISAALIVSRSTARTNLGEEVITQLTSHPVALGLTAAFLTALAMTSLPKAPMLLLGAGCAGLAYLLGKRRLPPPQPNTAPPAKPSQLGDKSIEQLLETDAIRIEFGYSLVRLVDPSRKNELLDRISSMRRQVAGELGLLVPPIRIRDNLDLQSRCYVILIRGARVAAGQLYAGKMLAVADKASQQAPNLPGERAIEPTTGLPAVWINHSLHDRAILAGYTVMDPATVLMAHLAQVVSRYTSDLLTRSQVVQLLEAVAIRCPDLVAEVKQRMRTGQIQRVLAGLLRERVAIRDMESILEAMCEFPGQPGDIEAIVEHVRGALRRSLSQAYCGPDGRLRCVCLPSEMEQELGRYISCTDGATIPAELGQRLVKMIGPALNELGRQGRQGVVLCGPQVRPVLRRILDSVSSEAAVLSYNEIDAVEIETTPATEG